jgi:type I restriction enzyme, R subunit
MESFKGIAIADTRECLLAALRAIKDPDDRGFPS